MSNPASERYLDIYEWRELCSVLRTEKAHLQEKVDELTKEKNELKATVERLMTAMANYISPQ